jgi:hypothetical protein
VTITEGGTTPPPNGFELLGSAISIEADPATASDPLEIVFRLDASAVPVGTELAAITVARDGVAAGECPGATTAVPDPCVKSRQALTGGDIELVVLAAHASSWGFVRAVRGEPVQPPAGAGDGDYEEQQQCVVPKVKQKKLRRARRLIVGADCSVGKVKRRVKPNMKPRIVLRQRPSAGNILPAGAPVRLTVSTRR